MDLDVMRQPAAEDDETGVTVWEAEFIDTATAAADDVRVTIPGYDSQSDFGPVVWTRKRDAAGWLYPQQGGLALVTQADTGRWWVLEWQP